MGSLRPKHPGSPNFEACPESYPGTTKNGWLTWIKENRPLKVGILLGAYVQTPTFGQKTFDALDLCRRQ